MLDLRKDFHYILLLIFAVFFSLPVFCSSGQPELKEKVLLLNSYHKGFLWTDEVTKGVKDVFSDLEYELHIEYMDTKRQYTQEYLDIITKLLRYKHKEHKYSIIIASDNNAFDYLKAHKNDFADDTPVVVCGVNYITRNELVGFDEYLAINERADLIGNIEIANQIYPEIDSIVIITDNTITGKRIQSEVNDIIRSGVYSNLSIDLWYDLTAKQLTDKLRSVTDNVAVLYTLFLRDKNQLFIEYDVSAQMVGQASTVPVFGCWDFSLGHGIIGGKLISGQNQGRIAAEWALKILGNEKQTAQKIIEPESSVLTLDYAQIKKFNIDLDKIPVDYKLVNEPEDFFARNKMLLRKIIFVFIALLIIIALLFFGYIRTLRLKYQLNASKTQLDAVVSNMPGAIYRFESDKNWNLVYLSEQIKVISGFSAADFLYNDKKNISAIVFEEDTDFVRSEVKKALNERKPWEITYRVIHKNGSMKWVTEFGRGVENHEGKIKQIDGLIIDITKRKTAEQLRKTSEEKLQRLFENSPVGILYYDKEYRIIDCNDAFASILGTQREKLLNFNMKAQLRDDFLKEEIRNSLITGTGFYSQHYESVLTGKKVPVRAVFRGIIDDIGIYSSGFGIVEDISDQIKAEQEIKLANDQLKAMNSKLVFAAEELKNKNDELVIALEDARKSKELEIANEELRKSEKILKKAHEEIKNKQKELEHLNAELKFSHDEMQQLNEELVSANDQLNEQKEELEDTIIKLKETQMQLVTSEKMASVGVLTAGIAHEINNPLNYIQGGKTSIEIFAHDVLKEYSKELDIYLSMIQDGIDKTVKIIRGLNHFNRRSDEFTEECDIYAIFNNCLIMLDNQLKHRVKVIKNYTTQPFMLLGNEGRLHQLFLNILQNSSQAISDKGEIELSTSIKSGKLVVTVSDNGSGISKDDLAKITDPFFTTKAPGQGTGLGLSIAYNIIQEHKGTIEFESRLNFGTTVTVKLPIM